MHDDKNKTIIVLINNIRYMHFISKFIPPLIYYLYFLLYTAYMNAAVYKNGQLLSAKPFFYFLVPRIF